MSSVSTTNISGTDKGTDNDFGRPSGTGVSLYRRPGTSYLATIMLSLRDKIHSSAEALLKLTLMGARPYQLNVQRRTRGSASRRQRNCSVLSSLLSDEAKPHKEASIRLNKRLGTNPSKRTTAPSNDNNSLSVHPVSIVATSLGGGSTNIVLTTTR